MGGLRKSTFPTWEEFLEFDKLIREKVGFRKMLRREIANTFFRLELKAPRNITGRETGYIYSNPFGYSVKIWTSVLEQDKKLRDSGEDVGWVIITRGDDIAYCARFFIRTTGFFLRLARYAWIAQWKINHIPCCPKDDCRRLMCIYRKPRTRQYMWRCENKEKHENPTYRDWDYGLGDKAKAFLKIRRDQTRRYKKRNQKLGKNPIPKAVTRRKWDIGRPDNKV